MGRIARMEKLEELVRVAATIRTGLNLYNATVRGIDIELDELEVDKYIIVHGVLGRIMLDVHSAVDDLSLVIDLLNEEMKSADSGH